MSEWISVEDKLPEKGTGFVITQNGYAMYLKGEWNLYTGAGDITHWMPLPEPPEAT